MDQILIQGGRRLQGEVRTSGAKNAALPILASTILGGGECVLSNMPRVADVLTMGKLLSMLGIAVTQEGDRTVVQASTVASTEAPYDLVRTMRASVFVLGPLVARLGEAKVSLPGGSAIGSRPVNFHLTGLEKMGATVEIEHGYIKAAARRLKGCRIYFDTPTATGTENLMMAAVLAEGTTVLENAAKEPEISDLAAFLVKRGARIAGAGTDMIEIEGVTELNGADHEVISDRIEAGTYLVAGAITGGEVVIDRCRPEHMEPLLMKLRESGVDLVEEKERVHLKVHGRLKGTNVRTSPHPGFPTDMQAQFVALMAVAEGTSVVTETIFESRFMHVEELRRLGADIRVEGNRVVITGKERLTGTPVMASDLPACAGLIVAGIAAEGIAEVSRVYHLDRGYERLEEKLRKRRVARSLVVWSASSAAPAANWASPPNRLPLRLQRFGASVRVVLDTNIFVSGLLSAAGPPARILQAVLQRRLIPVMSPDTFAELEAVLRRPKLQRSFTRAGVNITSFLETIQAEVQIVDPHPTNTPLRDAHDRPFIDLMATTPPPEYFVTGDKDFEASHYSGVPVISAAEFARMLAQR